MKKWQIIDLIRSASILAVMGLHTSWIYRNIENPWGRLLWNHFQRNGLYGVYLFFVVSGFLISSIIGNDSGGLFNPHFRKFYVRRAGRILPLYIFSIVLGLAIFIFTPHSISNYWRVQTFFNTGRGFDPLFWASLATFSINFLFALNPLVKYGLHWWLLWSLSVEEQFYFLFPAALKWLKNSRNLLLFLGAFIFLGPLWRTAAYFYDPQNIYLQIYFSLGAFDLIAFGILLYMAVEKYRLVFSKNKKISFFTCLMGFVVMFVVYAWTDVAQAFDRIYASTAMAAGLFCFLLGGLHLEIFESRYLRWFSYPGKYCFGVYIFHQTIFCWLYPFFLLRMGTFIAFSATTVICVLVAAVSYHFFEMPVNQFIRKKYSGA
ncbi:MAG TPA: acyltransferase [bacterium]|nr:acyltransferase [bacterium]